MPASTRERKPIRAVARALQLLRLINQQPSCGLREMQALSGLPKPTVFRLLRTLQHEGYLEPDGIPGVYHMTAKVLELSRGFNHRSLIVKLAAPIALARTRAIKWPLAIGTLDRDAILVRYSTMPYSPLAVTTTTLGHRHELLDSAMGHAYLRACGDAERRDLIARLQRRTPRQARRIATRCAALLSDGATAYGLRLPQRRGDSATLAVAVRGDEQVLAILSLTSFGRTMTRAFIAQMLPELRASAQQIEAAYARFEPDESAAYVSA